MKTRHRLQLYTKLSNRGLVPVSLLLIGLLAAFGVDRFWWPFLGRYLLFLWLAVGAATLILIYYLFWLRFTYVEVKADHLLVQGSFTSIRVPIGDILSVTPSQIAKHYPVEELSFTDLRLLSASYDVPCAFVRLDVIPVGRWARRFLFPRFIFATERDGLLLLVKDWLELTKAIDAARVAWQQKQTAAAPAQPPHSAQPNLAQFAADLNQSDLPIVLVVEPNSSQNQRLQQLLRSQNFAVEAAANAIDGLQTARQREPQLILVNAVPQRMELEAFVHAIRRHRTLRRVPILLMATQDQATAAADWLQAGVTDFLILPTADAELRFRIHNALEMRKREDDYETRLDLLQAKTLSQMGELMRRGELLNFLPATVAQQIMSGQISGRVQPFRRTKATVLFVDIVGFTDLTGRLDPAVLAELLNEYLREMTAAAIQFNGTVDKFIGDAVMVLYGAPQEMDEVEQAWNAAQTAVAMLKAVEGLDLIWRSHLPRELQVRVGFNTGYCTVGVFGNELLQSYTVVGSAVNIASRLQTAAAPNSIITSAETYDLIKKQVTVREMGYLSLKNVGQPVEAYELLSLGRPYK